ncbi:MULTISPECIES: acyl-CoA desaturase [unclassified Amycolatopsis]|uniref:fatty acid desaturase family protein n=1 Tax=unclassified Amycolatopsis TaxID=2618356 RepID=UPI001C698E34|nr:acyl-CoA desaturase [Amycolatopsis sp. DSM 110486]QYN23757.1 acyl-CoA desaturase [Amycolatopsis sp. DSM 110486]
MTSSSTFDATEPSTGSDFAELSRLIKAAGLLKRRRAAYGVRIGLNLAAFAGGWVAFAFLGDSWWQLFLAAFFAMMFAQLAFIGHDAGHKQIFSSRKANDATGLVHGGLTGLSYGWWIATHNRHHANPNHEDEDPDVDIAALAFSRAQSHEKRGFLRWVAKYQAFLFFPLLLLEGLNLHVSSVRAVWAGDMRRHKLESVLLIGHLVAYLAAVFIVLSPLTGLVFIVVHQFLWGLYMGCSFAPNHKGMEMLTTGHKLDFLRKQVLTSRNIRGGVVVDFALGGLNYQIEHHLFPSMARGNLKHAQVIVREFCARHGISYAQCGWARSYGYVLEHLHSVGAPLRERAPEPATS